MASYKHNPHQTDIEYRKTIEEAIEQIANELEQLGYPTPRAMTDEKMIELALKKIRTLQKMLLATGFSESMLKVVMSE